MKLLFPVLLFTSMLTAQVKPNVILILADDLGYADVGYHGGKEIPTPNIDSYAENGVQFSAGYAMAPVCGPSRAGMLTGRYQNRFGFEDNPGGPYRQSIEVDPAIPLSEITLGEKLKSIGYATAWIGKDHQSEKEKYNPINRGFDEFFGFTNGASNYFIKNNPKNRLLRGVKPVASENEYLTDAFGREAIEFIKNNKTKPFFLYLPFNAVHGPLEAKPEDLNRFKHISNKKRRTLAAMHYSMDQNIGRINKTLEDLELTDNTVIVFYSDNGGKINGNYSYNTPLKGEKGMVLDGGIRVPFVMQWKGHFDAGKTIDFPVAAIDIYPTILDISAPNIGTKNKLDGVSLLPYLKNANLSPENRYLYWRFLYQWAVRDTNWKLLKLKGKQKLELYHIVNDISESKNVIDDYPEIAEKLKNAYDKWSNSMMKPQWSWQSKYGGPINMKTQNSMKH